MKLSDAKEWLPIIQAAAEGKEIEVRHDCKWIKAELNTYYDFPRPENYRIKPEPKLIKGAAYLCWDDGDEEKVLQLYVGNYEGRQRFDRLLCKNASNCFSWDNWELFVQPPEALDQ